MNGGISWRSAVAHWHLHGPQGSPELDMLVAVAIASGLSITCLIPGTDYRVEDSPALPALAEQVNALQGGFNLAHEVPEEGVVSITSEVAPRASRRTVHIAGHGALSLVARAVDAGLVVRCAGIQRWAVSGRTSTLMNYLAEHVHQTTLEDTLKVWGLDPAAVAAEDADADTPTVRVLLPDRKTTSTFTRDAQGDISSVTQISKDM